MNKQHFLLLFFWILYGVLHSFFANADVKFFFQKHLGTKFKYYRLAYSLFAAITLILLLWYQFSIYSTMFFTSEMVRYGLSLVLLLPGLIIMIVCINKYFYELSGIQAFQKNKPIIKPTLQQNGLHKYVRHPLYSGTILFVWGLFLMFSLLSNLIAAVVLTSYVFIGISMEEKKLLKEYGNEYYQYSRKVPKLIPGFRNR
ncbi:MAG: isoprenylcysteine carboxylmethyltransferase family protein [Bacteroidota bacterium]|nr:isoprenylcysteine carboxylmethyltransferase family protein [Bacteroidota bacterium]